MKEMIRVPGKQRDGFLPRLAAVLFACIFLPHCSDDNPVTPPDPPVNPTSVESITFDRTGQAFALTWEGMFISQDDGTTWRGPRGPWNPQQLAITSAGRLLISQKGYQYSGMFNQSGKNAAKFYYSDDVGLTWTMIPLHAPFTPLYIAADASDQLYAIFLFEPPQVRRSTNLGLSWTLDQSVTPLPPMQGPMFSGYRRQDLSRLVIDNEGNLYLRGYRSTDHGYQWEKSYPFHWCTEVNHHEDELVVGPDGALYAADYAAVLISSNHGRSWTTRPLPLRTGEHITCLAVDNLSVLYAGTGGASMLISKDGGLKWTRTQLMKDCAFSVSTIAASGSGTVLACTGYPNYKKDAMFRSTDQGDTWELLYSNIQEE